MAIHGIAIPLEIMQVMGQQLLISHLMNGAGMATWDHTPHGRGYDTSLGYFHHVCASYLQICLR